ncbi:hypothetical protein [Kribbella sp. CA-247076]|uniref:hypothetical protein n=1 Tax=Kribbella sp. CA-247076 TaxID=3239941 RepID=UPI003D915A9E
MVAPTADAIVRMADAIVRNGFASRQIGPQSRESGMIPTQIQTYNHVGAGFSAGELLPNHAAPSINPNASNPASLINDRTTRESTTRVSRTSDLPAVTWNRGRDQNAASAKNDTATAAPAE